MGQKLPNICISDHKRARKGLQIKYCGGHQIKYLRATNKKIVRPQIKISGAANKILLRPAIKNCEGNKYKNVGPQIKYCGAQIKNVGGHK